ncbi:hypothetical protein AQUCO_05300044v1 [Aquilegia coerulea]|uniref:Uncharacterized protein n=1 Tax=Aquilegia coerulea TaxID=218851 RepID=A0A2G5CI55_AQUCA|nr:hypothetical protein AQUCO_05300044v1 [Aquilegia coerulea]
MIVALQRPREVRIKMICTALRQSDIIVWKLDACKQQQQEEEKEKKRRKQGLGWIEWARGWFQLIYEMFFQRIAASHLENPLPLPSLNDLTCIVTGSTSGIGLQTARQLAESGAHVVMAVRNPKAGHDLVQKWQSEWPGVGLPLNIEVMELNLLSLDSVVRFAEAWNARLGPLHVLINNAGIFSLGEPQRFSKDGYEEHMQVNHLAPALLSILLLPLLSEALQAELLIKLMLLSKDKLNLIFFFPRKGTLCGGNLSMHAVGFVDTEDMNVTSGKRKFSSLVGYSSSKLAQIMFSTILQKRLPAEAGINVLCVSPGIVHTNVARDLPRILQAGYRLIPYFIFDAREDVEGSDDWPVCAYISHDCRPSNASEEAHNLATSHRVWEKTLEMTGLSSDVVEKLLEGEEVQCRYGLKQE